MYIFNAEGISNTFIELMWVDKYVIDGRVSFYTGMGNELPRLVSNLTDFFGENKEFSMILGKIWKFQVVFGYKTLFWG